MSFWKVGLSVLWMQLLFWRSTQPASLGTPLEEDRALTPKQIDSLELSHRAPATSSFTSPWAETLVSDSICSFTIQPLLNWAQPSQLSLFQLLLKLLCMSLLLNGVTSWCLSLCGTLESYSSPSPPLAFRGLSLAQLQAGEAASSLSGLCFVFGFPKCSSWLAGPSVASLCLHFLHILGYSSVGSFIHIVLRDLTSAFLSKQVTEMRSLEDSNS